MFQFFTEDFAGFSAQTLNWIALGASVVIAVLILLLIIKLLRGSRLGSGRRGRHARLAVTDAASIGDDRRKLVLVRRDNVEHLLLIGGSNDLVIESDIVRTAPQQTAARAPVAQPSAPTPAAAPPAPVSNDVKPTAAPAAAPAPQTPTPAAASTATPAPVPAPAATPAPATGVLITPAPASSTAPVTVAAATATAAAAAPITSTTPPQTATAADEETIEDNQLDNIEIWDNSPANIPSEINPGINIETPAAEPVVVAAAHTETVSPMNSVEEMDALLNEITTEK